MKHLRFSYAVLAICAALLVYGLVEGTSRTSALFVGQREANGQVDAGVAFPVTSSPTAGHSATAQATHPAGTQIAEATQEPPAEQPDETIAPTTEEPQTTPSAGATTPTRAPRTRGPSTVTATPEACASTAILSLSSGGAYYDGAAYEIDIAVLNSGAGQAAGVVLGFSVADGGEYLDEGVFGNGQLWWAHGQEDAGVIYAVGDIGPGASAIVTLIMSAYPEFRGGADAAIRAAVIDGGCVEGETQEAEVVLIAPDDETATPDETPAVDGTGTPQVGRTKVASTTPEADETPAVTGTPSVEETPDVDETPEAEETAEPTATNTAVPTSTSTAVPTSTSTAPATPDGSEAQEDEDEPVQTVLGAQATPPPPTQTPLPLGRVLPGTGEGHRLPGGASAELYVGMALLVVFLGGAAIVGRRFN